MLTYPTRPAADLWYITGSIGIPPASIFTHQQLYRLQSMTIVNIFYISTIVLFVLSIAAAVVHVTRKKADREVPEREQDYPAY